MRDAEGKCSTCEIIVGMRVILIDPGIVIMFNPEFYFHHFSVKYFSLSKETQLLSLEKTFWEFWSTCFKESQMI